MQAWAGDAQRCEVLAGMAMNSEPSVTEAGQDGSERLAGRLAYSVDEVAHLTGLSRDLLYDQMRRGNLHYIR
jgi:hypothetical protein